MTNDKEDIVKLRTRFGWSQTKLANRLNEKYGFHISKHEISKLENGYSTPKFKRLRVDVIKLFAQEQNELEKAEKICAAVVSDEQNE